MPSISLHQPSPNENPSRQSNPLPQILHTPTGLALLELQGSVLSEQELSSAINLGHLVFPSSETSSSKNGGDGDGEGEWDGKRVFLFVGKHQRMAGEVKKLGKAIAVVRKSSTREEGDGDGEVEVEGIVRYKMIFGSRPEPMGAGEKILGGGSEVEEEGGVS